MRENKNFVIGRLLRDNEIRLSRRYPIGDAALRISVYEALECKDSVALAGSGRVRYCGIIVMLVQLGIAAIPAALYLEWGVLMITAAGTWLALLAGSLPQWSVEKLPNRRNSYKNFALTSGNGSRDIMVVLGCGNSLDLEELAAPESPRSTRLWAKHPLLSRPVKGKDGKQKFHSNGVAMREAIMGWGVPYGFWITAVTCTVQSLLWITLLIAVAGLKSHSWYLIAVGGVGMFQNAAVAAISRGPEKRNLPLRSVGTILTRKVMDGLMDLEVMHPGLAQHLLDEFFPGELRADEVAWWRGDKGPYDKKRFDEKEKRGVPRSPLPNYVPVSTPKLGSENDPDSTESASPPSKIQPIRIENKSHVVQAQEVSPTDSTSAPPVVPMSSLPELPSPETTESIGLGPEPLHSPGVGVILPKTPSNFATTQTRPELKDKVSTRDYAQMTPALGINVPLRRETRETEKTDSSGSTAALSMHEIDTIVRTPDWN